MIILLVVAIIAFGAAVAKKASACERPVRAVFLSALSGCAALFAVNAVVPIMEINLASSAAAVILGVPGVLVLILIGYII